MTPPNIFWLIVCFAAPSFPVPLLHSTPKMRREDDQDVRQDEIPHLRPGRRGAPVRLSRGSTELGLISTDGSGRINLREVDDSYDYSRDITSRYESESDSEDSYIDPLSVNTRSLQREETKMPPQRPRVRGPGVDQTRDRMSIDRPEFPRDSQAPPAAPHLGRSPNGTRVYRDGQQIVGTPKSASGGGGTFPNYADGEKVPTLHGDVSSATVARKKMSKPCGEGVETQHIGTFEEIYSDMSGFSTFSKLKVLVH